jgi:hypothetical protein
MRKLATMAAIALVAAGCGSKSPSSPSNTPPNSVTFTAALNPANEVPPITNADASGSGTGTFKMDLTRDSSGTITAATATFTFSLSGFPAGTNIILGHIHTGGPGVTGGAVVSTGLTAANPIVLPNGSVSNQTISGIAVTGTLAQQIIDNPNGYYYNLHTTLNPGGAVRAQLVKQ